MRTPYARSGGYRHALAYGLRRSAAHKARGRARQTRRAPRGSTACDKRRARASAARPVTPAPAFSLPRPRQRPPRTALASARSASRRRAAPPRVTARQAKQARPFRNPPAAYGAARPLNIPNPVRICRYAPPSFLNSGRAPGTPHSFWLETCRRHAASQGGPGPSRGIRPFSRSALTAIAPSSVPVTGEGTGEGQGQPVLQKEGRLPGPSGPSCGGCRRERGSARTEQASLSHVV